MENNKIVTIPVGRKQLWVYVTACITSFNSGYQKVMVRGRGREISKAVDVVNALKNSFLSDLRIDEIRITSDKIEDKNLSKPVIEIIISK
ncbi:RNA-binding protein [Candidatus Bathyarchaeota archaeon ex4484_205]|nr:MAG: RNA-binding protein [Candidatus Bathyarchaeota archaeon ex4484_205]RLG68837.1 MAG: RNA-binding protein [archaeon]